MVLGLHIAVSGIVSALGPGLLGLVRGWSGYALALGICVMLELAAAAIVLIGGDRRHEDDRHAACG
jgi:hypothetical protein